jgi:hypothetical protein
MKEARAETAGLVSLEVAGRWPYVSLVKVIRALDPLEIVAELLNRVGERTDILFV